MNETTVTKENVKPGWYYSDGTIKKGDRQSVNGASLAFCANLDECTFPDECVMARKEYFANEYKHTSIYSVNKEDKDAVCQAFYDAIQEFKSSPTSTVIVRIDDFMDYTINSGMEANKDKIKVFVDHICDPIVLDGSFEKCILSAKPAY